MDGVSDEEAGWGGADTYGSVSEPDFCAGGGFSILEVGTGTLDGGSAVRGGEYAGDEPVRRRDFAPGARSVRRAVAMN